MSTFNEVKIYTPGGNLYTNPSSNTSDSSGASLVSGSMNSGSACETCLESVIITNLGQGHPVYQGKGTYNVFNYRSIVAGSGTTITHDDKTITIGIDTSGIVVSNPTSLDSLTDVSINESTTAQGQVLTWSGSKWIASTPATGSSGAKNLSELLDVSVNNSSTAKGQVLTWNGSKWDAETPATSSGSTAPAGTSSMYVFHLPIIVKAGVAGVTGFGTLPAGWTATVTDPSTQQYNITVTHNTGLTPFALVSTATSVLAPSMQNAMILGTNTTTTAYLTFAAGTNSFTIYGCGTSSIKMSPNPNSDQTATLHIMMA